MMSEKVTWYLLTFLLALKFKNVSIERTVSRHTESHPIPYVLQHRGSCTVKFFYCVTLGELSQSENWVGHFINTVIRNKTVSIRPELSCPDKNLVQ